MQKTLMEGLNEKDMQAVIRTYDLKPYYYPTLFPLKETNLLTWKMLEAQAGLKIAADIVARGATIPKKTREAIERLQGNIPKIGVAREKLEDELTEYDLLLAMAGNSSDQTAIVEFWAEDTKFCWEGIAARLEWTALREISLGKVSLNGMNNAAVVSEFDADYQIPSAQKIGVATSYAGATNGTPFTNDFPKALAIGKKMGVTYKSAFMNVDTFTKLATQEETIKRTSTLVQSLTDIKDAPDAATVNAFLSKQKEKYKGLQIVVIDQDYICTLLLEGLLSIFHNVIRAAGAFEVSFYTIDQYIWSGIPISLSQHFYTIAVLGVDFSHTEFFVELPFFILTCLPVSYT